MLICTDLDCKNFHRFPHYTVVRRKHERIILTVTG